MYVYLLQAYRMWIKRQGYEEPPIVGLNMTNDQIFFLTFAQVISYTHKTRQMRM